MSGLDGHQWLSATMLLLKDIDLEASSGGFHRLRVGLLFLLLKVLGCAPLTF
jgi:hypothetical protein